MSICIQTALLVAVLGGGDEISIRTMPPVPSAGPVRLGARESPGGGHVLCTLPPPSEATYSEQPWPGGDVPFGFDPNVTAPNRVEALRAMEILEGLAQVDFYPATGETARITFRDADKNCAPIGHSGGERLILIDSWTESTLVHELLHVLGFYHEQARPDRDEFVQIFAAQIEPGKEHNFDRQDSSRALGPYDFASIMHYPRCAFSLCSGCGSGCETILPRTAYAAHVDEMGSRDLSALDVYGLRAVYAHSSWRFVDGSQASGGDGSGLDPWDEMSTAHSAAPSGATVFVLPGAYPVPELWDRALTIVAPSGGVELR